MALIIFAHGNSFPASTYTELLAPLRAHGHTVHALEKIGHNPAFPVTSNWPYLIEELAHFARPLVQAHGEQAYFVGHSLGGFLSLMLASQHPELVRGVVMLDSPLVGGWRAKILALGKRTGFIRRFSPGKISQSRRNLWPNKAAVKTHFASKAMFAKWSPAALEDYIEHGTEVDSQGRRVLAFRPAIETAIYNTLPHHLSRLLRQSPVQCGIAFIGGEQSFEMKQVGLSFTRKLVGRHFYLMPGSHLFPLEHPAASAAAVLRAMDALEGTPQAV